MLDKQYELIITLKAKTSKRPNVCEDIPFNYRYCPIEKLHIFTFWGNEELHQLKHGKLYWFLYSKRKGYGLKIYLNGERITLKKFSKLVY